MADTCRGDFPDKHCSDCGVKGCFIKHWGPLCPDEAVGYFGASCECWVDRCESTEPPKPFKYNHDTGETLDGNS